MAPNRRQAFMWSNAGLVYWRIYASFGLDKWKYYLNEATDDTVRKAITNAGYHDQQKWLGVLRSIKQFPPTSPLNVL